MVTIALAVLRRQTERRRWSRYQRRTVRWLDDLSEAMTTHPQELADEDWQAICEHNLAQSGFTPSETVQLIDIAVIVSKRLAADRFFM